MFSRIRGAIGQGPLPAGRAIGITRCRYVHTALMSFTIDCVGLDSSNRILYLFEHVAPWALIVPRTICHLLLEMNYGEIARNEFKVGDRVHLIQVDSLASLFHG